MDVAMSGRAGPGAFPPAGSSRDSVATGLLIVLGGGVIGVGTVLSPQIGCAAAITGAVALLYLSAPSAGLLALWAVWLLTPGLRRAFGLLAPQAQVDPLSVAPFVATAAVAGIQMARTRLDARTRRVLILVGTGLVIGVPAGAASPSAMLYALIAYGGAAMAFVLGRLEDARTLEALSLRRALVFAAPILALYGIAQYFLPLTSWDRLWLGTVAFESIGAPEQGHVRIFSTLNAPGTFAVILSLALLCYLTARRASALMAISAVVVMVALALTYVRGAWICFVVAALAAAALVRTRTATMTIAICTVVVAAALSLGGSTATSRAFTERLLTFGSLSSDTSANQRVATPAALLPGAVSAPLGHGLGTAGEATRLRPDSPLRAPDNGYLSLLYQLGPAGLLLILTGAATPLAAITKRVVGQGARDPESVLLFAVGVFMVLLLFGGDLFYGVTGVMLWYLLGRALAVSTRSRRAHRRPPEALTGAGPDRSSPPTMVAAQ